MDLSRALLVFIGRRIPAIFDVIPRAGQATQLDPHPLPPEHVGAWVAREILREAWMAERFNLDL
jgi:hypothetical protein